MIRLKTKITLGLLGIFVLTAGLILFSGLRDLGPALLSAEEKAVSNIFQLIDLHVSEAYNSLLDAKIAAITQRKNLLAAQMNLATTVFTRLQTSGLDNSRAQKAAIGWFAQLSEAENRDWRIIDAGGQYLVGPDDQLSPQSAFSLVDLSGRPAVEDIATGRTGRDSGFVVFAEPDSDRKFLGYFQRYAAWNWTIAQVLDLADIEALAEQTRQRVLRRLHDSFAQITLPGHGSVFLFDSRGRMLVDPQPNSTASSAYLAKLQQQIMLHLGAKPDLFPSSPTRVHFTDLHQDSSLQVYASSLRAFDSYAVILIPTPAIVGPINQLLKRQALLVCLVFALGLLLAMAFARQITTPLLRLVATMRAVTLTDNYQLRNLKTSNDEIGQLVDGFNQMLSQIAARDQQLENYQKFLEQKVVERTHRLRKTISALELANRQAEAANLAKSAFLANVTHELRTPMIGVLGMNELLSESFLNPQQRALTVAVSRAGNKLLDIINQILDFSLLETGGFELQHEEVDLHLLSEELMAQFAEQAVEKNLALVLNVSPEAAWRVEADARRLRQILRNLIDNALKFTHEGQVALSLARLPDGRFVYRIADSGIGIDPQDQETVFGVFTQLDETSTRSFSGTGLGLAMVRALVRLMAGEIRVESSPQQGSVFEILLPLKALEPVPLVPPAVQLPSRVLLCAAPSPATDACALLLKSLGLAFEVGAESSPEILHRLEQATPSFDLVILAPACPLADQDDGLLQATRACQHIICLRHTVRQKAAPPRVFNVLEFCLRSELIKIYTKAERALPQTSDPVRLADSSVNLEDHAPAPRILVVDDHLLTLELIRLSLQKTTLRYDEAKNAEDVLHAVAHADYHLILMDVNLPGTDGLQLTRQLRAQGFEAPICALTAHDHSFIGEQCIQAGMQELLRKPFRQAELFALLDKYLAQPGHAVVTESWRAGGKQ